MTHFTDLHSGEVLARLVFDRLDQHHVDPQALEALTESAAELTANAAEHAESTGGGYLAAFTHRSDSDAEFIVLAVGDVGIGLRDSLRRAHAGIDTDLQAVEQALVRDVSGTGQPGRGQGLAAIRDYVRQLGGWMVVRSGTALRQDGPQFESSRTVFPLHGTLVGAWIPCHPGQRKAGTA